MVSRTSNPQPTGYPTLRSAQGGNEMLPTPRGTAVPIEPRMGARKTPPLATPGVQSPPLAVTPQSPQVVCFQCPSCTAWLRIEDSRTYAGEPSQCPTCQVTIVGPRAV